MKKIISLLICLCIISKQYVGATFDSSTVSTAENGEEALEIMDREHIDLVILDIMMPKMDGISAMVKIREKTKGKHLWVRTIGSSAIGYMFDSVPFVLIAFAGMVTVRELVLMIGFQYLSKLVIETVFGTPMAYAAIRYIRKYVRLQEPA